MTVGSFFMELAGAILLFCLVFGMSGTVDSQSLKKQVSNKKAIVAGLLLQFVVLPILGFVVVNVMNISPAVGLTLLVVTSSPGGSYSNWWCSLFNADLALSVTMTAISTIMSVFLLPINLMLYATFTYGVNVLELLDWLAVFMSLGIVIIAILLGRVASYYHGSPKFHLNCNRLGNVAGIALVVFSAVMSNTDKEERIWERDWQFYVGTALPCVAALLIANVMTTLLELNRPERVTVSIECCYQNVGIATTVALTMFDGDELAEAMGVPFFYGVVEAVVLGIYCLGAWKAGWTKAPVDAPIWSILLTSYEVIEAEKSDEGSATTELTAETAKRDRDIDSDEEEAFHYVQHSEAEPDENDVYHTGFA